MSNSTTRINYAHGEACQNRDGTRTYSETHRDISRYFGKQKTDEYAASMHKVWLTFKLKHQILPSRIEQFISLINFNIMQ